MFATWNYRQYGSITHRSTAALSVYDQWDNEEFVNYPYGAVVTLPDGATVSKNFETLRAAKQWISKTINKHYN